MDHSLDNNDHTFAQWLRDHHVNWDVTEVNHVNSINYYFNGAGQLIATQLCDNQKCTYTVHTYV